MRHPPHEQVRLMERNAELGGDAATWLRGRGADPSLLAPFLGHADSRMADRLYGRHTPETLAASLQRAIGPASHRQAAAGRSRL